MKACSPYVGWFSPSVKPTRVGVYETFDAGFQHWNGSYWGYWCPNITEAQKEAGFMSANQSVRWRGITRAQFIETSRGRLVTSPIDTLRLLSSELCTASPCRLAEWTRFIDCVVEHAEKLNGSRA